MATTALDQQRAHTAAGHGEKTGLWSWLTTVDHKRIGILYGATAFFFFLLGGIEALLLRIQLGSPDNTFLSPETYNELFTMHGTTMIFLAIMPLTCHVLQLHDPAADRRAGRGLPAAERLQLLGVPRWAGCSSTSSFLFGAAPDQGWFGYANLTSRQFSPGPEHRLLGAGPPDPRHRLAGRGGQLLRDDRQPARAGHEADAHADVRLDELHHPGPAAAGLPGHHGRADPAHVRPLLRHPLLRPVRRWRSAALAAPVLDLRAPRGLHPDPAGLRHRLARSCRSSRASRCSATRRWSSPACSSPSSASACGATTCSRPAWARSRTPSSR